MREKVYKIVEDTFGPPNGGREVSGDLNLTEDFDDVDSLCMLELALELEEEFDIDVDDSTEFDGLLTVNDIIALVEAKVRVRH